MEACFCLITDFSVPKRLEMKLSKAFWIREMFTSTDNVLAITESLTFMAIKQNYPTILVITKKAFKIYVMAEHQNLFIYFCPGFTATVLNNIRLFYFSDNIVQI